jgi:hypothetical protein
MIKLVASAMIGAVIAFAVMAWPSNFDNQQRQVARCTIDAEHIYPAAPDLSAQAKKYVQTCMEAAGYFWVPTHAQVCENVHGDRTNTYCYMPTNRVARFLYDLEVKIGPPRPSLEDYLGPAPKKTAN